MQPVLMFGLLVILFFSVIVHEVSHGLAALRNGDDTARLMGRLTFNPLPHVDPIGTVVLPLLLILTAKISGGMIPVIGWAKPVPVNPFRFRDYRRGTLEVGAAGPLANIVLALAFALLFRLNGSGTAANVSGTAVLLYYAIFINFLLAAFNLIPIPPLDGSRIVSVFLPFEIQRQYARVERYGIFLIFGLLFFGLFDLLLPLVNRLTGMAAGFQIPI